MTHVQLFLFMLILGFLAGPRIFSAVGKAEAEMTPVASAIPVEEAVQNDPVLASGEAHIQPTQAEYFSQLDISAKSVFVWDVATHRKLYGKNEYAQLPLASVAKVMMALVATELLPDDHEITVTRDDITLEGDNGLLAGERWKLSELLRFTLVVSSNDGASAIASVAGSRMSGSASTTPLTNKKLFVKRMNERARELGLFKTYFNNESGLDIASLESGAYGTARDMAMLFEYVWRKHPDLFSPTTEGRMEIVSETPIVHHIANTNAEVDKIAGILGSKTGYTDLAGGNLVLIVDVGIDHPVVIAVLGSTREGRFSDAKKLIDATVSAVAVAPAP